uniref:Bromo domain-containing protein n=1 Tax=Panagrolaimus sp. PS1159 TaxID=55785 RepID=A0AC35F772_9BILA
MSESPAAPPRDRPSMVGLPPTATVKSAGVKSPGRRGRKPKSQQSRTNESESEMDLTVDESNPATPSQNENSSVQEDDDGNPTPAKKRRGRPPEATSVRAQKEKLKLRREKDKERRVKKKKEPKVEGGGAEEENDETTEQDQEMEATEDAESDTEEDQKGSKTTNTAVEKAAPTKNVMPDVYLRGYSSFQLFCDYILRKLMNKDPEEYFAYPVSDIVAPDYHKIITKPMNFLTIRQKISGNEYPKLEDLKADVILICDNAMLYNPQHTIYHTAAQKLLAVIKYYFSEDYLEYLRYTLPFGKDLERQILGLPEKDLPQRTQRVPTEPRPLFQKQQMESITAKKLLADAPAALKKKLTTEVPKWPLGYIDNHEGAVALNLVTSTEAAKIPLGDLIGKIEAGHTGLLTNFEDAFPALTPSSYLNYEPFASFAPMYDTTWATMNQRDSELLTQTYGDRENAADIFQLRQMVVDSGGYFLELFDNMLNTLTDGEHSRVIDTLHSSEKETLEALEKNNETLEALEKNNERETTPTSFSKLLDDISTLENIGIDTSFIDEIKADCADCGFFNPPPTTQTAAMMMIPEEEIERNGYMIQDLTYLQNQRLTRTITNLADVPQISDAELELSSRLATNFQQQIIQFNVAPNEIGVTPHIIHNAIGVNDEDDYDILREFMDDV